MLRHRAFLDLCRYQCPRGTVPGCPLWEITWAPRFVEARSMVLPLPKGEGWGEGEGNARLGRELRQIPRRSRVTQRV
jgi:hypothetical protein